MTTKELIKQMEELDLVISRVLPLDESYLVELKKD